MHTSALHIPLIHLSFHNCLHIPFSSFVCQVQIHIKKNFIRESNYKFIYYKDENCLNSTLISARYTFSDTRIFPPRTNQHTEYV